MIKIITPFILSFLIPYFAHAQSCKSILGASINIKTILMEIASLSQDVELAKLSGDTTAFISLESSLKGKITEVLNLGIISDEELKLSLNNQSENLIKKAKEELKEKKENREMQNRLLFIARLRSENNIISWFNDFKNLNETDQKAIVTELNILKNQDKTIAEKINEISLIWNTDLDTYKEILKSKLIKAIDFSVKDLLKNTPLHEATARQEKELAELLIQNGVDVNAKNIYKNTSLHLAISHNKTDFAELLIRNGADVNAKDNFGKTPLYLAIAQNKNEFAKLLIKNGADVNAKNNFGNTPLHFVTSSEITDLLIKNGADVNAKNNFGNTPLHMAVIANKEKKILELLIKNGANVNAKNNKKEIPLDLANSSGADNSELVKLLKIEMAKP